MRRFLLIAAALAAFAAHASTLRLVEPRHGVTLRGGSQAAIEWSATSLPAHAEEWEAFLSLDGGKYYAFRITPHLDLDLHRVTWLVPNVDTHDARLLIRTGDERRETLFEFSAIFSIVRDPNANAVERHLVRFGRGESAREGDAPVVSWADGTRNGGGVTQQYATTQHPRSLTTRVRESREAFDALVPAAGVIATPTILDTLDLGRDQHARVAGSALVPTDLLLVCRRLNI